MTIIIVSRIYLSSLYLHLLGFTSWGTFIFCLHLLLALALSFWIRFCRVFCLFLLFGWWRRCRFGHDLLDFLINFLNLILDISSSDSKRLMFRQLLLFLISLYSPLPGIGDSIMSFLPLFWWDMLIFLILNKQINTKELRYSKLVLRQWSKLCSYWQVVVKF